MKNSHKKILKLTQAAFLFALIVVLQIITYFIKLGPFNLSFVLVPIVVGGFILGPKYGTVLGAVFGLVVTIVSAMGMDGAGFILFSANPVFCTLICVLKGAAAGFVPAMIYKAITKNGKFKPLAMFLAAASAPVMNTGIFCLGMAVFYKDILSQWAGGTNLLIYTITGLVGINFIFELVLNLVLCPVIGGTMTHILKRKKK